MAGDRIDAANRYITINLNTNTWTYQLAPGVIWSAQTMYSIPLSLFRADPLLPMHSGTDVLMIEGASSVLGGQRRAWGGQRRSWGDDGTYTGCYVDESNKAAFIQEIEHSFRIIPLAGGAGQHFPYTLFFPSGKNMRFTGVGARANGTGDMLLFGPRSLAGFIGTAQATTRDHADVDTTFHTLALRTNDAHKTLSAYQMHENDTWTRIYAVSNTMLRAGDVLTLTVSDDKAQFEVINNASEAKTFDLGLGHVGSDGVGTIVYPAQPIGANERRIYTPLLWTDLEHAPIRVDIDINADGTIDRTEILGGHVFPAVTHVDALPATGATFAIITHDKLEPGHFGWVNLDQPLVPGQTPTGGGSGNNVVLRKWLKTGGNPGIVLGGGLVGITGTHGNLFQAIGNHTPGHADLYRRGDVMVVPLYDTIMPRRGSQPLYYRIAGMAVVQITGSHNAGNDDDACHPAQGCRKAVMGKLLAVVRP